MTLLNSSAAIVPGNKFDADASFSEIVNGLLQELLGKLVQEHETLMQKSWARMRALEEQNILLEERLRHVFAANVMEVSDEDTRHSGAGVDVCGAQNPSEVISRRSSISSLGYSTDNSEENRLSLKSATTFLGSPPGPRRRSVVDSICNVGRRRSFVTDERANSSHSVGDVAKASRARRSSIASRASSRESPKVTKPAAATSSVTSVISTRPVLLGAYHENVMKSCSGADPVYQQEEQKEAIHPQQELRMQQAGSLRSSDNTSVTDERDTAAGCEVFKSKSGDDSDIGSESSKKQRSVPARFKVLDVWLFSQAKLRAPSFSSSSSSYLRSSVAHTQVDPEPISGAERSVLVQPGSVQHLTWEIVGVVLIFYDIVVIPLQILNPPSWQLTVIASWFIRIFWTMDIPLCLLTGYLSPQGEVEMRLSVVAREYAKTRLFLDVILVGCDWVEAAIEAARRPWGADAAVLRLLGMLRAIRLVRLVRLVKSQKITEFIFENIRSEGVMLVAYIALIMMGLLVIIHIIACLWFGIRSGSWGENVGTISAGGGFEVNDATQNYVESFHSVLALFAGEQLLVPVSLVERLFTVFVLIFAFVVSATFVGSLTTAMTRLQIIASQRSTQFAALRRYMSDNGISRELTVRVQRNARHALQEQKRNTPESNVELLRIVSDPLRAEIHYEQYAPVIIVHPFFGLYNLVNAAGVRHICHTSVSMISLSRGDVLFSACEVPVVPKMYFVVSGKHAYAQAFVCNVNSGLETVQPKQWLAEAVLWTSWTHRGLLRALCESRVLALDGSRFANVMSTFPSLHLSKYAAAFVEELDAICASGGSLTDIGQDDELSRTLAVSIFQEDCGFIDQRSPSLRRGSLTERRLSLDSLSRVRSDSFSRMRRGSALRLSVDSFSSPGARRLSVTPAPAPETAAKTAGVRQDAHEA